MRDWFLLSQFAVIDWYRAILLKTFESSGMWELFFTNDCTYYSFQKSEKFSTQGGRRKEGKGKEGEAWGKGTPLGECTFLSLGVKGLNVKILELEHKPNQASGQKPMGMREVLLSLLSTQLSPRTASLLCCEGLRWAGTWNHETAFTSLLHVQYTVFISRMAH